jgi:hypothetical protein
LEPGVALGNQVDSVLPADGWRPVRRGENTAECRSDQDLARGGALISTLRISLRFSASLRFIVFHQSFNRRDAEIGREEESLRGPLARGLWLQIH